MNRDELRYLAETERLIALGKKQIANQQAIIEHLESGHRDASIAREVLHSLLATQSSHEERCAKILRELAEWSAQENLLPQVAPAPN